MAGLFSLMTPSGFQGLGTLIFPPAHKVPPTPGFSPSKAGPRRVITAPSKEVLEAMIMKEIQDKKAINDAIVMRELSDKEKNSNMVLNSAADFATPEEYVASKGVKAFHGSPVRKIESLKLKVDSSEQFYGPAVYLSTTSNGAKTYGENVTEVYADTSKFLDLRGKNPLDKQGVTGTVGTYEQFLKEFELADNKENFSEYLSRQKQVADDLMKEGYSGVIDDSQIAVFDEKLVLTKSQLTSEWQAAQKGNK